MDYSSLSALTNLRILDLRATNKTGDEALATLATLVNLEEFYLGNGATTDKTIENVLVKLPKLRILHLTGSSIRIVFFSLMSRLRNNFGRIKAFATR